jgi:hypothetical protein
MVSIDFSSTNMLFFLLGFLFCACLIVVLAIAFVVFPHITEAKRFFNFYLKVKDKESRR